MAHIDNIPYYSMYANPRPITLRERFCTVCDKILVWMGA
jgi:hypothetical protein